MILTGAVNVAVPPTGIVVMANPAARAACVVVAGPAAPPAYAILIGPVTVSAMFAPYAMLSVTIAPLAAAGPLLVTTRVTVPEVVLPVINVEGVICLVIAKSA